MIILLWKKSNTKNYLRKILTSWPDAIAEVYGSEKYPTVHGTVSFYQMMAGTVVVTELFGLPFDKEKCSVNILGFHIHEGSKCAGNEEDPFADAMTHYNPLDCPHPAHAGDLPPLFVNDGYAWSAVLTNRIQAREVIGRTVIVHSMPDDFKTQPSGDSGTKIACGVIS